MTTTTKGHTMRTNCKDCGRTIRRVNSPETGTYCTCLDEIRPIETTIAGVTVTGHAHGEAFNDLGTLKHKVTLGTLTEPFAWPVYLIRFV